MSWCRKYGKRKYTGEGAYEGNFPRRTLHGYFEVEYTPAITEGVENPAAYPVKVRMLKIIVPEEVKGQVKVPTPKDSIDVFTSFKEKHTHRFRFIDVSNGHKVSGLIESVFQDKQAGPSVLGFTSTLLELIPLTISGSSQDWPSAALPAKEEVEDPSKLVEAMQQFIDNTRLLEAENKYDWYEKYGDVVYEKDFECYKWLRACVLAFKLKRLRERAFSFEEEYYDYESDDFHQTRWVLRQKK